MFSTFYKCVSGCVYVEMNSHGMYTKLHRSKLLAVSVFLGHMVSYVGQGDLTMKFECCS